MAIKVIVQWVNSFWGLYFLKRERGSSFVKSFVDSIRKLRVRINKYLKGTEPKSHSTFSGEENKKIGFQNAKREMFSNYYEIVDKSVSSFWCLSELKMHFDALKQINRESLTKQPYFP